MCSSDLLWSVADGERTGELTGHKAAVTLGGLSRGGDRLVTAGYEGQVKIWDTADWELQSSFEPGASGLFNLALSPHGGMVAIASERNVAIWSLELLNILVELPIKPKGVYGVAFSPEGEFLACAAADKQIRVWSVDAII